MRENFRRAEQQQFHTPSGFCLCVSVQNTYDVSHSLRGRILCEGEREDAKRALVILELVGRIRIREDKEVALVFYAAFGVAA